MFGSSNGKDDKKTKTDTSSTSSSRSNSPSGGHGLNTITEGTKIQGDLVADSDIRIDGQITGNLKCSAKVIIGAKGSFDGDVNCTNAVIEGKFTGKLFVTEMLQLKETSVVNGDLKTNRLAMAPGCDFSGTCETGYKGGKSNNGNPLANRKEQERTGAKV
ncbi:MAG: polymer-forming cytoskeletal protein [Bacteroidota bacterium]